MFNVGMKFVALGMGMLIPFTFKGASGLESIKDINIASLVSDSKDNSQQFDKLDEISLMQLLKGIKFEESINDIHESNEKEDKNESTTGDSNNTVDEITNENKQDNENDKEQPKNEEKVEDKNDSNKTEENGQGTESSSLSEMQKKVVELVNAERSKAGLKPLKANVELSNVATKKSQDMIDKNYFSHTSPTYGSPFDMMKQFGIDYRAAGENIAMGQRTPEEVMKSWMNSSGHRKNILSSNFTEIGIGIAKDNNGTIYWTQMFIGR